MKVILRRAVGFSLIELAVVLAIIGLLLMFLLPTNTSMIIGQRRANTTQKLVNVETALLNYVIVNKRLPCPANGTLVPPNATAGVEGTRDGNGDCSNPANQANGVVPYVSLGLQFSDAVDSWDNQITYRVGYGLTRNSSMDMSFCDPAGTASQTAINVAPLVNLGLCNTATCVGTFAAANCTSPSNFLLRKGLDLRSGPATLVMSYLAGTGAAYVLVSHGENGYGALNNAGTYLATASRGVAGTTLEDANRNLATLTVTSGAPPIFMSASYSNGDDATTYFDDIVIRPMVFSVISKANLAPRSH
jgi:prepilin-type N-terminal cleavage/methylation domain-containing protein